MLIRLGYGTGVYPQFASHITIELYEKEEELFIRSLFNGEPFKIW
jgi:hypothetical protein